MQLNSLCLVAAASLMFAACGSDNGGNQTPGDGDTHLADGGDNGDASGDGAGDDTGDSTGDVDPGDQGDGETAVAPTFQTQPQDRAVTEGNAAVFIVAVDGTPAPELSWETSDDGGALWVTVAGATANTYTIAATTLGQSGLWVRAVASNVAGGVTSNTATLTVTAAATVGNLVITAPTRIIDELGGNLSPVPAPNGAVTALALTAGGRIILSEASANASRPSIVSVLPDGTGRVVLVDSATSLGNVIGLVAVSENDTVYYREQRGVDNDTYLGSIKSDGTNAVTPIQITGADLGSSSVAFFGFVAFNDVHVFRRYTSRIFTTSNKLVFALANGSASVGVFAVDPTLTPVTTVLAPTPNALESPCGVTPDGQLIYTRLRTPGVFTISDVYALTIAGGGGVGNPLNPAGENRVYRCQVTRFGHVVVETDDAINRRDLFLADGGGWVNVAASLDSDLYLGEASDGSVFYKSVEPTVGRESVHVWNALDGDTTLFALDDAAGAFGGLVAVTPDASRVLVVRSATFDGQYTLYSTRLDGTDRLTMMPSIGFRSYEPFGITASGRLIYRGMDQNSSPRLFSARTDEVVSPGVPDQVMLLQDPTANLQLLLD